VTQLGEDGKLADNMYAHAIGTIALCDAAALSKDDRLKTKAASAVAFIVKAQGKNGSWGYVAGQEGDTSILGWQVQALTAARLAGIEFDSEKVFGSADNFLESVSTDWGTKYGYREPGKSQTLTPVGLVSRYTMGTMPTIELRLAKGVEFLKQSPPRKDHWDMYFYYYATRAIHLHGGDDWHKLWNPKMRDLLIDMQDRGGDDAKRGSWPKDKGLIGEPCGRLGTTALAILTLEVYYRYPSLRKDVRLKVADK
jgi:hypothetical protein